MDQDDQICAAASEASGAAACDIGLARLRANALKECEEADNSRVQRSVDSQSPLP